jgi:hypothetical protein
LAQRAAIALEHGEHAAVGVLEGDRRARLAGSGGHQPPDLRGRERTTLVDHAGGVAEEGVQHAVGAHRDHEAVARQRLQEQPAVVLAAWRAHRADDLGAAGGEADPGCVGPARECVGGSGCGIGCALDSYDPAVLAQAIDGAEAANAQQAGLVQTVVAARDRLI